MSNHAVTDSHLPTFSLGSPFHGHQHAPLYAPDSITVWQSSPPKYTSAPQDYYDFDVEELSDNDMEYPDDAQILRPYELEEVDSPVTNDSHVDGSNDMVEEDGGEVEQDSDSAAFTRRLRRMRWKPASRPYSFTRSSPTRPNPRKRLRSEALDTDTDTDSVDSSYARSEPPRTRRRTRGPDNASALVTPSRVGDNSTPQASTAAMYGDPMDVDEQAT